MIYDDLFLPILQLMEEFQEFLKLSCLINKTYIYENTN